MAQDDSGFLSFVTVSLSSVGKSRHRQKSKKLKLKKKNQKSNSGARTGVCVVRCAAPCRRDRAVIGWPRHRRSWVETLTRSGELVRSFVGAFIMTPAGVIVTPGWTPDFVMRLWCGHGDIHAYIHLTYTTWCYSWTRNIYGIHTPYMLSFNPSRPSPAK